MIIKTAPGSTVKKAVSGSLVVNKAVNSSVSNKATYSAEGAKTVTVEYRCKDQVGGAFVPSDIRIRVADGVETES